MTQSERLLYLIKYLLDENQEYGNMEIPIEERERFRLYRSLVNVRLPKPVSSSYLEIEKEFLREEIRNKGITHLESLVPADKDLYLWQGDITTIDTDSIVNAANSALLGCFYPCHSCIDNCIHTFAGVRLRLKCNEIMKLQGKSEPVGKAKLTPAYNLPSRYVLHTVGPVVSGGVTQREIAFLASCYRECLELADLNGLKSIAFCCISTGEFHFPNEKAAQIAVSTVKKYKKENKSRIKVVFNVFKDKDYEIYRELLCNDKKIKADA